jgi:hypothetical protein
VASGMALLFLVSWVFQSPRAGKFGDGTPVWKDKAVISVFNYSINSDNFSFLASRC